VAVAGGAVLLVPPALATLPVAGQRTEVGEPSAVSAVCAALSDGDVVVAVDVPPGGRAVNEWPQVVRGVCGRPAASLALPAGELRSSLQRLGELTSGAGSRLVLLAAPEATGRPSAPPAVLTGLGLQPRRAVRLESTEDQRLLTRLPSTHNELAVEVWTAPWPAPT
jgi:hypothetical protein